MEGNSVNSPNHYMAGGIETIDYIKAKLTPEQWQGYCLGNIMKYTSRYLLKNGAEDLQKADKHLKWLIASVNERP
ncbi:DUF3310 domain-containing protein [Paenibacillus sp. sgz302251]|uniref:DUF3310 domain-containing protein n=1 Tax=Paenibacillus sp. sgz302251 TaxID=3414493 RepID=UPI003C7989BB